MVRLLQILILVLFSYQLSYSQKSTRKNNIVTVDSTEYYVYMDWQLSKNYIGEKIEGGIQGVFNTKSFYWAVWRTPNPDYYGNYTFYVFFYPNVVKIEKGIPKDYNLFFQGLDVFVNKPPNRKLVYNTSLFIADETMGHIEFSHAKPNPIVTYTIYRALLKPRKTDFPVLNPLDTLNK